MSGQKNTWRHLALNSPYLEMLSNMEADSSYFQKSKIFSGRLLRVVLLLVEWYFKLVKEI